MLLGFVSVELDPIQWLLLFNFLKLVRILVCSLDQFLTQIIKEFQYIVGHIPIFVLYVVNVCLCGHTPQLRWNLCVILYICAYVQLVLEEFKKRRYGCVRLLKIVVLSISTAKNCH